MKNTLKQNKLFAVLIGLVFLTAIFFHFLFLDRVPAGMSHDEVVYALSIETFFLNRTDITGTHLPLGFFQTPTEGGISLFPPLILSPLHLILPVNQAAARVPYVIFLFLSAAAVFLIGESVFKNKKIASLGMIIFLFEPWSFFLARFATDTPISLVLYLWSIALLLRLRGRKLIYPFLLLLFAFYSYHGEKIIFIPLVVIETIYLVKIKQMNKKEAWSLIVACLFVFISFFVVSFNLPSSIVKDRQNELFFLNKSFLSAQVNLNRSLVLDNPYTSIFVNKYTEIIITFLRKYITAFSVQVLFIQGDSRLIYSFLYHGILYFFDLIFIPVGLFSLFLKKRSAFWLIVGIIIISPIPSAVSGVSDSYVNRSILLLPIFSLLSGFGLYEVYNFLSRKITPIVSFGILLITVAGFISSFLFFYFYEFPFVTGDNYAIGAKVASEFIKNSWDGKKQIEVITQEPGEFYLEVAFFFQNETITKSFVKDIPLFNKDIYKLKSITITGDCPKSNDPSVVYLVEFERSCPMLGQAHKWIKNPRDSGIIYSIYNNNICSNISSSPWTLHSSNDYSMESMGVKEFCQRWISS